ncbi:MULTISPECIES: hypothetical protein [Halanaerobium]|jgi:hypothetical protein|uniref:Uncharacterized protein n=1 Tax=Halanaerobium kushneri TaxID=56779 RepID=A0A1N6ZGE0_9FIRM|nr:MULTISPECIES: hypothetical protein [Halanaerobium]RCW60322.1 hypothetical protein DFR80_10760 [Halanaerobium sp. ST460_2HS_T2]SIR25847.1 hypothetical protein SAMN05421834_1186 [Halanaerobium kushneri]
MKLKFRVISGISLMFMILFLNFFLTTDYVEAAAKKKNLIERSVQTEARIPVFQRVEVVDKADIDYTFLMANYSGSREIIIEDGLSIEILSNADWYLRLNNRNLNTTVMIKKADQSDFEWQKLNSTTAKFRGEKGVRQISFDLKFILDPDYRASVNNLELDLRHSITPVLY